MPRPRVSKRLNRLIRSGICPAEDASEYAEELKQLAEQVASEDSAKKQSKIFKALADQTRLKILGLLGLREMCVCEIMVALDLTQPTASYHLGLLENVGLIKDRKEGKWVFYSLENPELVENMLKIDLL
jgi:ArsR family transcriptional regulator